MDVDSALTGMFFRLQHDEGCTFAQIQTGPLVVERPASLLVQDHQRMEAVQMETGKGLCAAGNHHVSLSRLDEVGS